MKTIVNSTIEEYLNIINKLEHKITFFEFFNSKIKYERYNKLAMTYEQLGLLYKLIDIDISMVYLSKSLKYYTLLKKNNYIDGKINDINTILAELLSLNNYKESIKFYDKVIKYYIEINSIYDIIKYCNKVASLHINNNNDSEAIYYLQKVLSYDKYNVNTKEILAEIYIFKKMYDEAAQLYYDLGSSKSSVNSNKYYYLYLLSLCAANNLKKCKQEYEKLMQTAIFLIEYNIDDIINSIENVDIYYITNLMKKTNWDVNYKLLSVIKKNIISNCKIVID